EMVCGGDARDLLARAQRALHAAYEAGGNCICGPEGVLSRLDQIDETTPTGDWLASRDPGLSLTVDPESDPSEIQKGNPANEVMRHPTEDFGDYTQLCDRIRCEIVDSQVQGRVFSIILIHLDDNPGLRHSYAARVPKILQSQIARAVRESVRQEDRLACFNDTTLGLILPGTSVHDAVRLSTRLRRVVRQMSLVIDGRRVATTVSLGIAESNRADDAETLLERARTELSKAIAAGGDRVSFPIEPVVESRARTNTSAEPRTFPSFSAKNATKSEIYPAGS
ncbi:MAG: GGDEF domain-containing protein, partial [Pirellulaceae bacterium]